MSRITYNNILLNINRRNFELEDKIYEKVVQELKGKISLTNCLDEIMLLEYELNVLNKQYEQHNNTKTFPKSSNARNRKEAIGALIDDKHHSLLTHRIVKNTYGNLYCLDLSDSLDIAISVAFDISIRTVRDKLGMICERNGIDYRVLSRSLMCQDDTYSPTCNLPFVEITREFREINNFIKHLCKNEMEEGIPYLDSVTNEPYSHIIKCDNLPHALVTAFNLKILLATTEVITDGLVQFELQRKQLGFKGGIVSQYLSGFVVEAQRPLEFSYTFQKGLDEITFNLKDI